MAVLRQGVSEERGRVNQKRRTRAALVGAAKELLQQGTTPTVAQAAEAALVSRTTAYRYFPTQESLLLEVAVDIDVHEVEALVNAPVDADHVADRTVAIVDSLNRHVFADEVRFRTLARLYLDQWLAAVAAGDDAPVVREGRRRRWLAQALEPVADRLAPGELDRLTAALSLLTGAEAMVVLRDVCQLGPDEALGVTSWAARTLLEAALPTPSS